MRFSHSFPNFSLVRLPPWYRKYYTAVDILNIIRLVRQMKRNEIREGWGEGRGGGNILDKNTDTTFETGLNHVPMSLLHFNQFVAGNSRNVVGGLSATEIRDCFPLKWPFRRQS